MPQWGPNLHFLILEKKEEVEQSLFSQEYGLHQNTTRLILQNLMSYKAKNVFGITPSS